MKHTILSGVHVLYSELQVHHVEPHRQRPRRAVQGAPARRDHRPAIHADDPGLGHCRPCCALC